MCVGVLCVCVLSLVGRVFVNSLGDRSSIPDRIIPKTPKTILDDSLLNIEYFKVDIKGKVEQFRERDSALLYTSL